MPEPPSETPPSLLASVAKLLSGPAPTLYVVEAESHKLQVSRRHLLRMMCATAELAHQKQAMALEAVASYVQVLCSTGEYTPTLFLQHCKFDETPLSLHVRFGGPESVEQVSKTFVVEHSWAMLVCKSKDPAAEDCLCLRGSGSPTIRVSQNTTGETISRLVAASIPSPASLGMFKERWTLTETDAAKSNARAGRIQSRKGEGKWAHATCAAHRCHQVATKTWTLDLATLSALKRSLLILETPSYYLKFRDTLIAEIKAKLVLKRHSVLPQRAMRFREAVLRMYAPSSKRTRAASIVTVFSERVLNGDWQLRDQCQHYCSGCCSGESQTHSLIERWVPRVLKALSVRRFCKANWSTWHLPLGVVGYWMHLHDLWRQVFVKAFTPVSQVLGQLADAPLDPDAEDTRRWQVEMAQNMKIALSRWGEDGPEAASSMYVLRSSLQAEVEAMATLLEHSSGAAVRGEMQKLVYRGALLSRASTLSRQRDMSHVPSLRQCSVFKLDQCLLCGVCFFEQGNPGNLRNVCVCEMHELENSGQQMHYKVDKLLSGELAFTALRSSNALLHSPDIAMFMPPTEIASSKLFRAFARMWAVMYDNMHKRYTEYPYKLRLLISPSADLDVHIACFLSAKDCALDQFSKALRKDFGTEEQLKSVEFQQMLKIFFWHMDTSTYSTERLHSQNTRRTRVRAQVTHQLPLHQVALSHAGVAAPAEVRELVSERPSTKMQKQQKKRDVPTAPSKKRKRVGGGAARAYLHIAAQGVSGQRPSFSKLLQGYRTLDDDSRAYYQSLGEAGMKAHRSGTRSFPSTYRRSQHAAEVHLQQQSSMSPP